MGGTLHAEQTEDGKQIVLMGVGDAWEQEQMGLALNHLTPALKKTDPPVAVYAPCTWPTVVQLSSMFNGNGNGWWMPGERLRKWITDQFTARLPREDSFPLALPDGCVPRDYQVDGARGIAFSGRYLLGDDPGTGKTCTTILGLLWRRHLGTETFPAIVIVPSWDVADSWAREFAKWVPGVVTAMWGGPKRLTLRGSAHVYLTTYATARRDALDAKGPLVKLKAVSVIADEKRETKRGARK